MSCGALIGDGAAGGCVGHALKDFDVEQGGGGGDTDDVACSGAESRCGERGAPGAVTLLVLRCAVVTGGGDTSLGGLIDFAEVESEVGGDVGVDGVDSAVEDGDTNTFSHGGVPGTVGRAAGYVGSVTACLTDGPALG